MPRTIVIRIVVDNRDAVNAAKAQTEALKQLQMQTAANNDEMRKNELQSMRLANAHKQATDAHDSLFASFTKGFLAARALSQAYSVVTGSVSYLIKNMLDLELNFAKVEAVTGSSKTQISSLKDVVFNLGRNTAASTVEISAAALELAKLGFEGKNLEIALSGVARLSAVLGDSLETTGNLVGAVIQTFDLSAEEAAKVADKLFVATGRSATNISGFRTSFNYAGASAEIAEVTFDQLATTLAILSNNGIRASTAGSGLRSVFTELSKEGSKAQVALGGSIQGLGIVGVMEKLAQLKLSPGTIADIFGKPALPVVLNLAKMKDAFDQLLPSVQSANGQLENSAKIIGNTLAGSFKLLQNSMTEFASVQGASAGGLFKSLFNSLAEEINSLSTGAKEMDQVRAILEKNNLPDSEFYNTLVKVRKVNEAQGYNPGNAEDTRGNLTNLPAGYKEPGPDPAAAAIAAAKLAAQEKAYDAMSKAVRKNYEEIKALIGIQDQYNVELSKPEVDDFVDKLQKMANTLTSIGRDKEVPEILKEISKLKDRIREPFANDSLSTLADFSSFPPGFEEEVKRMQEKGPEQSTDAQKRNESQKEYREFLVKSIEENDRFNESIGLTKITLDGLSASIDLISTGIAGNFVDAFTSGKRTVVDFGNAFRDLAKGFIAQVIAMEIRLLAFKAALSIFGFFAGIFTGGVVAPAGESLVENATLAANGYDGIVNSPKMFIAGESGAERVRVSPLGKSSAGNGDSSGGMTIIIQGDVYNPEKLIDKVAITNGRSKTRYV